MRRLIWLCGLSLLLAGGAMAAPGAVRCGKLLNVRTGELLDNQVIVFDENGTITAVGSAPTLPKGVTAVDLSGMTCLPGLIDVHTHLTSDPSDSGYAGLGVSVGKEAINGAKNAAKTVRAGFTTVRNVGAGNFTDVALRDGINEGGIPGPRMIVSGPALGITGGHCDNNLLPYEFHYKEAGSPTGLGPCAPRCGRW